MSGIPVLTAEGECIARAWENSLIRLHEAGCDVRTQYDKPGDPPSKDATMIISIDEPLREPMIHKDFPGGLEDLQEYVMEVCDGIKDHLVRNPDDPHDTPWEDTQSTPASSVKSRCTTREERMLIFPYTGVKRASAPAIHRMSPGTCHCCWAEDGVQPWVAEHSVVEEVGEEAPPWKLPARDQASEKCQLARRPPKYFA